MQTDAAMVEKAVLGTILIDNDAIYLCGNLRSEHFTLSSHRLLFGQMYEMAMKGEPIDTVTLVTALQSKNILGKIGDVGYVSSLLDIVPDRPRVEHYAKMVLDGFRRRNLLACASAITAQCEDASEDTESCYSVAVDRLLSLAGTTESRPVHVRDYSDKVYNRVNTMAKTPLSDLPVGMRIGIPGVDKLTTGIRDKEFWVVASWTGEGKTVLATQIIMENAGRNVPVLWFTHEMSREQVMLRMVPLLTEGEVRGRDLRDPRNMAAAKLAYFMATKEMIDKWPLWVQDAASMEIATLYAQAVAMVKQHKVKLVVVDYIQLVKGRGDSRYDRVTDVSNMLRELAKNYAPVLGVSQLAKPERGDKRPPRIFDMKESGSIEQDAHVILMPYRPQLKDGSYTGDDLIIVGKQREGKTGAVKAQFDSRTLSFRPHPDDQTDYAGEMF